MTVRETAREAARPRPFGDDLAFESPKKKTLAQIGAAVSPLLGKATKAPIRVSLGRVEGKKK